MIDAAPAAPTNEAVVESGDVAPGPTPAAAEAPQAVRKPNKFMADLTKAMQTAAEATRADTLERLASEAKAHIETVHAESALEATELRKQCDDDVAGVREWSKQEIARIREETDERITHRKERLEREIEQHGAEVEARIERIQARVAAFEREMADFFEHLLAEEDPTRFAAMAENLPEPPPFDGPAPAVAAAAVVAEPEVMTDPGVEAEAMDAEIVETAAPSEEAWTPTDAVAETPESPETPTGEWVSDASTDWATQPVAETPEATEAVASFVTPEAAPVADAVPVVEDAPTAIITEAVPEADTTDTTDTTDWPAAEFQPTDAAEADPRVAALGLSPDFAAAEAEAAQFLPDDGSTDEGVAEVADETISARLAGLGLEPEANAGVTTSTKLVVTGLVSVASIAGFKRHLSRATGVSNVGVSSGPDGEFIFSVTHDAGIALRDVVPTLPGFAARVTGEGDGEVQVTAQDPETER